ncbi:MAG: hypothetical protein R6U96_15520 [Promethearchaeia archaeon]
MARTNDLCICSPRLRVGNIVGGVKIGVKPIRYCMILTCKCFSIAISPPSAF